MGVDGEWARALLAGLKEEGGGGKEAVGGLGSL